MKVNNLDTQRGIISLLEKQYGIKAEEVSFIPVGEESFAYKAVANNGKAYFIKYCERQEVIESLKTVNELLLQIQDLDFVIPPIVAHDRTSFELGKGRVYVFPFIEGGIIERGNDTFEKDLVAKLTKMMVQIHKLKNRIEVALPVEDFNNNYREQLNRLKIQVQKADGHIRSIFEDNKTLIEGMIEKQESEAERYKHQKVDLVLTHGDITGRNIIQATRGLKLVDWDGAMFAPAEKDINFLYDNPNFSLEEYYKQMGKDKALFNPGLKEYYGRKWAIESILGNFETLLEGVPEENRQEYLDEINEYLGYYK